MCVFISVLLAGTSAILKDRQLLNKKIDVQRNILVAAGINIVHVNQVEKLYDKLVTPLLISSNGKIVKDNQSENTQALLKIFCIGHKDSPEKVASYVYPIKGKGLWSSLYGYLSVNPTGDTIIGITFYKHGETPGLGAEIEKKMVQRQFCW
jgi:Na+-transporting NADH:ubiquinone oxidoreductase subunit C